MNSPWQLERLAYLRHALFCAHRTVPPSDLNGQCDFNLRVNRLVAEYRNLNGTDAELVAYAEAQEALEAERNRVNRELAYARTGTVQQ